MVRRAGAKPGDRVFVSRHDRRCRARASHVRKGADWKLDERAARASRSRYLLPQPRNALAEAVRATPRRRWTCPTGWPAISPSCAASPGRGRRSRWRACRCPTPPRPCSPPIRRMLETALTGGDDYEIVCTVPPAQGGSFRAAAQAADVPVTEIGAVEAGEGARFLDARRPGARLQARRRSVISEVAPALYSATPLKSTRIRVKRHGRHDGQKGTRANALGHAARISQSLSQAVSDLGLPAARARRRTCRASPSNTATPAPAPTSASRTIGRRFDADQDGAALRRHHHRCRRSTSSCSARRYAAPIGIAPMGGPSLVWPGADLLMAKAAQRARVPYTLGVAGGATIEEVAEVAPDVFWLQLYRFYQNDHAIGFDLIKRRDRRRRQSAGAHHRRAGAHHAHARNLCRARRANSAQRCA